MTQSSLQSGKANQPLVDTKYMPHSQGKSGARHSQSGSAFCKISEYDFGSRLTGASFLVIVVMLKLRQFIQQLCQTVYLTHNVVTSHVVKVHTNHKSFQGSNNMPK